MDIKPLRYLIAIAKTESFTKAAQQLGVAQPAVSMAIKKLENDLGLTLIHRADRNIGLTDEGKKLLLHAEKISFIHPISNIEININCPAEF